MALSGIGMKGGCNTASMSWVILNFAAGFAPAALISCRTFSRYVSQDWITKILPPRVIRIPFACSLGSPRNCALSARSDSWMVWSRALTGLRSSSICSR